MSQTFAKAMAAIAFALVAVALCIGLYENLKTFGLL